MTKQEIVAFLNANPMCHLATVEGSKPHVRGMMMFRADDDGIIFHSGKMKDLHKQLTVNPNVEICFGNGSLANFIQVRVSGILDMVEDLELKKEIVSKRDFMKPWVEKAGYEPLAVYRLKNGKAQVWTMADNFAPKIFIEL